MAPCVRSGRRTGHPKVSTAVVGAGGEDPGGRSDAGGEGRCLRTRWRTGAAGMLGNCVLSVGMLLLVVRCAVAAEEKPTYDASGSSSLPSDPVVTAASAHPLADLSVAEEVPFSLVHSDGDTESEVESLSGQPAFSSVLTVMAGTVKHPVSLDQSQTSPTITRVDPKTTQWPSHSSSKGSDVSSFSSSSAGERAFPASSGLTSKMFHRHAKSPQAVNMASSASSHLHVSMMNRKLKVPLSSSTVSALPFSSSGLSTSTVLSSAPSPFSTSAGWTNQPASIQAQRSLSSPAHQTETATLSPAGSLGWTDSLTPKPPTTQSVVDLPAISTTTIPSYLLSKTSNEKSNKVTRRLFSSSAETIHGVSDTYTRSAGTKDSKTPAARNNTSYTSPNHEHKLDVLNGPTQSPNMNSILSTSFLFHPETRAVQMQHGALQSLRSPSADHKGYSAASRVAEQMLSPTAYAGKKENIAAVGQKIERDAITSPLSSHDVNPTAFPEVSFRSTGSFLAGFSQSVLGKTSLTEMAITKLTNIHSGMVSSEYASNPADLLMAAGHGSPRDPAINIDYGLGDRAGAELKSITTPAHLNNSLSPRQTRSELTTGSILSLIIRKGTSSSTFVSDPLDLQSNSGRNVEDFVTQSGSPMGMTQELRGRTTPSVTFLSSDRKKFFGSIPASLGKDVPDKTMNNSLTPAQPSHLLPLFLSYRANHNKTVHTSPSARSPANFTDQPRATISLPVTPSQRPFQTRSLLNLPNKIHDPNKSHQTTETFSYIKESQQAGVSSPPTLEFEINAGNIKTSPASDVHMTYKEISVVPFTPIRHLTTSYKQGAPLVQLTTQFSSFKAAKDLFVFNEASEVAFKGNPTEIPASTVTFDAALEPLTSLSHKDNSTLMSHYQNSSWSDFTQTPTKNSVSQSGSATSAKSNKSNLYFSGQTTIPSTLSSAAASFYSDGQTSKETFGAIFSIGTKQMAPYRKWKATKPGSFQNAAVTFQTTSIGFDGANTNSQADGPSYEHPKLEDRQESNLYVLSATNSTVVAPDPFSLHPTAREHTSFGYIKGTSGYEEQSQNSLAADLRSALANDIQQGASVNPFAPSAQGSDGSLALTQTTAGTALSSHDPSPSLVYKNKNSLLLEGVDSLESSFITTASLSNSIQRSISSIHNIKHTIEHVPSSSETLPLSTSSINASHSSSLQNSVSNKASLSSSPSLFSISPTMYPSYASSSAPARAPFSSSSPSLSLSIDSDHLEDITQTFAVLTEAGTDDLTVGTSRAVALTFPKEKVSSLAPSQSARIILSAGPTERTSQVSPLPPQQDTNTASVEVTTSTVASTTKTDPTTTVPILRVTTQSITTTTSKLTPVTRRTTTTTSIRTQTSRKLFTQPFPRTSPPRAAPTIFISPFTTTTEAPPQLCNITERLWVKTVVSIYVRRNRLDSIQRQNLRRGLSQGLRKALNDSTAQAQVETVFGSPNMTVAYHVTGGDMVYIPSVLLEALNSYGRDKMIADLRQYLPMVTALPLPVTTWRPIPAPGFQIKTVLQFVGAGDDHRSCRFSQMMEQRLEKVFCEAQAKVLNVNSRLSVQMLSVSQAAGSPAVSLVYTLKNGTVFLNGTAASNLLGQLSAELVGYFLFYPPLIIAEPLEYHNLNTSAATRDLWVITVIQDVDNASLEGQYQSFASLMEQRLAELFVLAGQQGNRFRRATAVDSYTVQMVSIRRVSGLKNPAEMTYYVQHNGVPLSGTSAAKVLNTVDSQTMALTLGYFVQLQAEPVVKNPPNNLWILAAVLAPIAVVTLIIIIITAVLCRKNKNDFKADAIGNLNPRAKMAYRRDVGYYHQPVQGFDYAKQHLGQQGGDEETLPASQDTLVMSLQIRDTPLSLEKTLQQDGTVSKKSLTSDKHKSKLPSEDGSVISNESEKLNSSRALTVLKVTAQQKLTKEETRKRDDPYDTSSGSLQLISIKPMAANPNYSHPASFDRNRESAIVNGEVNLALKQKSDIEHYRNKLRLKAKRKGYYDFPSNDGSSSGPAVVQRQRHGHERAAGEHGRPLEPDDERGSTFVKSHRRHSQVGQTAYRSRQSLSSPSPGGTEMDLLVMRERPRRGIRNSGYDTEPELIEETNVDRLMGPRGYMYGRGLKGHSETSTLSSQPSIDEVRQQMHLLLEEAFSLASGGQSTSGRHSHQHHHQPPDHYSPGPPPLPYTEVVTSAPGTMTGGRGGLQWVPSYGSDVYQCSLPKPAFHFTQLPEMAMHSPPPLPPRTGPPPGTSLRRSTSDLGPKGRSSETSVTEMQSQHDNNPYGPTTRAALPSITAEQPVSNYSGNPITAVYAIPASRPGYSEYFVSTPPTSYHSPSWMSYPPEPEDVPPQWADSLPLPGYVEAFPHPRYPQGSPNRLPLEFNPALEPPPAAPSTASKQSLKQVVKDMDSMPLSSLSTSALVQAIRQEVAKLAKKQNDMFEF